LLFSWCESVLPRLFLQLKISHKTYRDLYSLHRVPSFWLNVLRIIELRRPLPCPSGIALFRSTSLHFRHVLIYALSSARALMARNGIGNLELFFGSPVCDAHNHRQGRRHGPRDIRARAAVQFLRRLLYPRYPSARCRTVPQATLIPPAPGYMRLANGPAQFLARIILWPY
jgi:hypothetical protein